MSVSLSETARANVSDEVYADLERMVEGLRAVDPQRAAEVEVAVNFFCDPRFRRNLSDYLFEQWWERRESRGDAV